MAKSTKTAKGKGEKPKLTFGRVMGRIGLTALVLFLVGGLVGVGGFIVLYATTDLPDPNAEFTTNTTFVYYDDGSTKLSSLSVQNRVTLTYDEIPQYAKDAVVAAENRDFWEDPGISISGIMRSINSIVTGEELQGGSTITQQYIKVLYLNSEQTLRRKVKELILAIKMGREVPKEEILAGYLNTVYFGRGAYGIEAASRSYFLKSANELSLEETATLAAILNNPAAFNPSGGEEKLDALFGRYQYVLGGMLEAGNITQAEYDQAAQSLPEFPEVPINDRYGGPQGFLLYMVEQELAELGFDESEVQGGGLEITTTINKELEDAAIESAQSYTEQAAADASTEQNPDDLHVSIASVDTYTGAILALYGGPDFVENSRNWATTPRPAASTFKAFAAAAGLRNGFSLDSILNGNTFTPDGDTQTIRNEFSYQYGQVTLRKAVADSINTAFVDMTQQMESGPDKVVEAANDAGAPTGGGWDLNNRITLGAAEVSPVNMANAYATFADFGQYKDAHIVAEVKDRFGNVVYEADTESEQKIEENVAANLTDALTSVVSEGTGTRASSLGRPVAGKTGTNGVEDEITSAWFVGYTRQISTAVLYVAGDTGNEDLEPYKRPQDSTFFGSSYPLMTWIDYMEVATEGMEVLDFDDPEDIDATIGEEYSSPTAEPSTPEPSPTVTETTVETEPPVTSEPEPIETETATPEPEPTVTEEPTATAEPTPTTTPEEDDLVSRPRDE